MRHRHDHACLYGEWVELYDNGYVKRILRTGRRGTQHESRVEGNMVKVKICTKCNEPKDKTEFYKHRSSKDGLRYYCKSCTREDNKRFRVAHPEYNKEYDQLNTERLKEARLVRKYGLTFAGIDVILKDQDNKCAICQIDFSDGNKPKVDHCHKTSMVRGALCNKCNLGLGLLGDTAESLQAACNYLKRSEL